MSRYEREEIISEIRHLTNPRRLKTEEEHRQDQERVRAICARFNRLHPEDVLEHLDPFTYPKS